MKSFFSTHRRTLTLIGVLLPLLGLFVYVALRSGPLAPVPVTLATVARQAITPSLFGVGTVESRYTHKIGPTFAGRIKWLAAQPGDRVKAGQVLGEMDPIDLDDRIGAQDAALKRAEAAALAAQAQLREAGARESFAQAQAGRYEKLLAARVVSEEGASIKRQESQVAQAAVAAARANLDAARQEQARLRAERDGLLRQRANLRLLAPVDGLISRRDADPGTTVVAGQSVVEVVEPGSLWISVRFDQQRALGLRADLPVQIVLRSQGGEAVPGRIARIEPHADAVTEEVLAKAVFDPLPRTPPPIGELAEVTVTLAALKPLPVVPNASIQRLDGRLGVWTIDAGDLRFVAVRLGAADLDGRVQILEGLSGGERVVVYSRKALQAGSRIEIVDRIVGAKP